MNRREMIAGAALAPVLTGPAVAADPAHQLVQEYRTIKRQHAPLWAMDSLPDEASTTLVGVERTFLLRAMTARATTLAGFAAQVDTFLREFGDHFGIGFYDPQSYDESTRCAVAMLGNARAIEGGTP